MVVLNGHPHPIMNNVKTTLEVKKLRPILKMLTCDYYTYELKASFSGGSPNCRLCSNNTQYAENNVDNDEDNYIEDIEHIITKCAAMNDTRLRILNEMSSVMKSNQSGCEFEMVCSDLSILTQFILDCCSLNLPNKFRLNMNDPTIVPVFKIARDLCYALHSERLRKLKDASSGK